MDYISAWCKSEKTLHGWTVIVTGCNTGIGKETAIDLFKRGARVIMACRDIEKAEIAKANIEDTTKNINNGCLKIEKLDLSSFRSIREFVYRVLRDEKQINILINNAGIMMCPEGKTEDGFEMQMGTNHLGHALLTVLLLPRLSRSSSGSSPSRIVFVSSCLHESYDLDLEDLLFKKTPYEPRKAYSWSKTANVLFARNLALKLQEHNIENVNTYSLHPGVICTDLGRHLSESIWYGATWAFNNLLSWFVKSPRCGAQTTIYCAVDDACAQQTGLYYSECAVTKTSKQCTDDAVALKLWDLTIEQLQLKDYDPFGISDPVTHI